VIAAPAVNQPRRLKAVGNNRVATKVAAREVKTSRDQIFGLVNS
jgi:hypothetical protein